MQKIYYVYKERRLHAYFLHSKIPSWFFCVVFISSRSFFITVTVAIVVIKKVCSQMLIHFMSLSFCSDSDIIHSNFNIISYYWIYIIGDIKDQKIYNFLYCQLFLPFVRGTASNGQLVKTSRTKASLHLISSTFQTNS